MIALGRTRHKSRAEPPFRSRPLVGLFLAGRERWPLGAAIREDPELLEGNPVEESQRVSMAECGMGDGGSSAIQGDRPTAGQQP